MFNRYLLIASVVLLGGCVLFYNLWDGAKSELNQVKAEKVSLEQEIKRRNENEKNLSKRISELTSLYESYSDYSNTPVPSGIIDRLSKSCKACK